MNAAAGHVFSTHGVYCPTTNFSTFPKSSNLRISIFPQIEITDKAPYLTSRSVRSTVWSIRCEGNRKGRPHRNTGSGGTDKESSFQSSDKSPNSSNQEEIIALFRRIQSSIAKEGGSPSTRKRRSSNQKDRQATESVLDVLLHSRKPITEKENLPKRRGVPKIKSETEDISPVQDFSLTRPPSNFVKKSPISKPTTTLKQEVVEEVNEEPETAIELRRLEEMKVSELKELAKSRGIKGYSKLKKAELVDLLKGEIQG